MFALQVHISQTLQTAQWRPVQNTTKLLPAMMAIALALLLSIQVVFVVMLVGHMLHPGTIICLFANGFKDFLWRITFILYCLRIPLDHGCLYLDYFTFPPLGRMLLRLLFPVV